ncbi:RNase III [Glarea lozoyensis ATCC 20868]|uniref:RNase III n=1 Tax=Glarea lozoyensis (strain ATCC 20868 / MF5171) TaxID=1116229 RepID=S3DCU5_GLAL2|nr:RNase III [Glarea lozoyensis ATCC 20868]EPE36227.1 RNase III [Glarea lozoyensis ATCC 20868]
MEDLGRTNKRKYEVGNILDAENGSDSKKYKKSQMHGSNRDSNNVQGHNQEPWPLHNPSSHMRFARLAKVLDETIEECLKDGVTEVDADSLKKCLQLQKQLQKSKNVAATPHHHIISNIPSTLPTTLVTPWNSRDIPKSLPTLPLIHDETLEKATFTHTNSGSGKITDLDYEQLEWVGDAYIELIATLLISKTFPALNPGKSSQVRERLVKNTQLSEYSRAYGFHKRINLGPHFAVRDNEKMIKIFGDIFEAYVAAVILSDPVNGLQNAVKWLKDLWSMTIKKDIVSQENSVLNYSSPLWNLSGKPEPATKQSVLLNPKDQLAQAIGAKVVKISYRDTAKETKCRKTKLPIFSVGVFLDGWGEKDKKLGEGKANGKKEAGFKAAEQALNNKKMMTVLIEKKRLHDEQRELERLALENAQAL